MQLLKTKIEPTYRRDSGLWVLNIDTVQLPEGFTATEKSLVYLPSQQIGGNHRHPRTEVLLGMGDLEFAWLDEQNNVQRISMNENGELLLITVPPYLPHAVLNRSNKEMGILFEYANSAQHDVEPIKVI